MLILPLMCYFSACISIWLAKNKELSVSAVSAGGSYDVKLVYGWYSDNSVFLEDPGRLFESCDPAFIRRQASKPRRLLETRRLFGTRRLIEVYG